MSLEEKILTFVETAKNTLRSPFEHLEVLELKLFSPDELSQTGYLYRESFNILNSEPVASKEEIESFFEKHCISLTPKELGCINFFDKDLPLEEIIYATKINAVGRFIEKKLYEHITQIKTDYYREESGPDEFNYPF